MEVITAIEALLRRALSFGMIRSEDEIYARNQILSLLGLDAALEPEPIEIDSDIPNLLECIIDFAVEQEIISGLLSEKAILSSKIMNVLVPKPSEVNDIFNEKYGRNPIEATNYFYQLSKDSNYIQTKSIAKNISYTVETQYGELDVTINLSKPEKDPKQIARELEMKGKSSDYPKCLLCAENEGYAGRVNHPARSNHRLIRLELTGEPWFFQYSPYLYYNEHSIILSGKHRDMKIDRGAFSRLLEFVEKFPHYFLGSNADLPIVGGSILTHDHYQGGQYEFAMAKAEREYTFSLSGYPSIEAETVKWPLSVIRLRGTNKNDLANAAEMILEKWKSYRDADAEIIDYTGDLRHNTITPIVRMRGNEFEMDLVLRNNRTSAEHPLGIFHPHADVHHIKKENIGLIEVMGLAVLPARLATELIEIENFLLGKPHDLADYHVKWAEGLKEKYSTEINDFTVTDILRKEVGLKFLKALEDAGVFKRDEAGLAAFHRFTEQL